MAFGIIVPAYTVKMYLKEYIGSILTQTYKDYEIIMLMMTHKHYVMSMQSRKI